MTTNEPGGAGSGQKATGETVAKRCNLLQLYIKGVSFEAPAVPGILFGHEQPVLQFDVANTYTLSLEGSQLMGQVYAVVVRITVQAHAAEKTLFLIEVEQGGLFEVSGYATEELDFVLRTKAPEALYPYARELVSSLVNRAGFPRLQLKPFSFETRYSQAMQEYQDSLARPAEQAAGQS